MATSTLALSSPPLTVPPTQNTAPIYEHNCLYTYDVRRKNAKRWQDGFLRFHTFNKRCMLYDVPRNFIGDTHWQESDEIQDGDEITLDKTGVLVQVADRIGATEADLNGLWEHRKDKGRGNSTTNGARQARVSQPSSRMKQGTLLPRNPNLPTTTPRPLTARANISHKSPFEERQARLGYSPAGPGREVQSDFEPSDRPTKRPRNDEDHIPLWQVLRTFKPANARNTVDKARDDALPTGEAHCGKSSPSRAREKHATDGVKACPVKQRKQSTLKVTEMVDLTAMSSQEPIENSGNNHVQNNSAKSDDCPTTTATLARGGWFFKPNRGAKNSDSIGVSEKSDNAPTNLASNRLRPHELAKTVPDHQNAESASLQRPPKARKRYQQISLPNPSTPSLQCARRPPGSPPVSTRNRLKSANPPTHNAELSSARSPETRGLPVDKSGEEAEKRPLRVISRSRNKMLVCQSEPKTSKRTDETAARPPKGTVRDSERIHDGACDHVQDTSATMDRLARDKRKDTLPKTAFNGLDVNRTSTSSRYARPQQDALLSGQAFNTGLRTESKPDNCPPHARLDAELLSMGQSSHNAHRGEGLGQAPRCGSPLLERETGGLSVRNTHASSVTDPILAKKPEQKRRSPMKRAETITNGSIVGEVASKASARDGVAKQRRHSISAEDMTDHASTRACLVDTGCQERQRERLASGGRPRSDESHAMVEDEVEQGPWTREAFDLFGCDIARKREEKTGRSVEWLEKYNAATMSNPGNEGGGGNGILPGFQQATKVISMNTVAS